VTHVDLWRLGHLQEVVDLALEEELDDGGVVIVEWGEAAEPLYGDDALVVRLGWGRADDERTIAMEARGASWSSRAAGLREAAGAGRDTGRGNGG
jgi:tRNA A37 threonylcarbamoyladenosine biosynthesis protein TsaE